MNVDETIVLMLALALINYRLSRSVLYPPFLFSAVWLFDLTIYRIHIVEVDFVHAVTLNLIGTGALSFTLGGVLALTIPGMFLRPHLTLLGPRSGSGARLKSCMIIALALGTCIQMRYLGELAASVGSGGLGLMLAARSVLSEDLQQGASLHWFTYITSWAIFAAVLFQVEKRDRWFRIMALVAVISCFANTGRGQLLMLVSALTAVYLLQTGRNSFLSACRMIAWPMVGFISFFIVLMFTNKDTSKLQESAGIYILQSLVGYLCGSMAALDLVLTHRYIYFATGALPGTLKSFFSLASAAKLMSYSPPPMFESYVFVPFPINTFTVYKSFAVDYGLYGCVCIMGIIGFLHSLLYRKARFGTDLAMYLFALSMYPVLMIFFVDSYTSFSLWANAIVFGSFYLTLRSVPGAWFRPHGETAVKADADSPS